MSYHGGTRTGSWQQLGPGETNQENHKRRKNKGSTWHTHIHSEPDRDNNGQTQTNFDSCAACVLNKVAICDGISLLFTFFRQTTHTQDVRHYFTLQTSQRCKFHTEKKLFSTNLIRWISSTAPLRIVFQTVIIFFVSMTEMRPMHATAGCGRCRSEYSCCFLSAGSSLWPWLSLSVWDWVELMECRLLLL